MKKFLKYLWIVILVLGITIGIIGIVKLVSASKVVVPNMGASDWFDKSVLKSDLQSLGVFLCVFGFGFIGLTGTLIAYFVPRTIQQAKEKLNQMPNILNNISTNNIKEKKCFCNYCGTEINKESKCPNCGAVIKKSNILTKFS